MHYDKHHPFLAAVKKRTPLTKTGSQKGTLHLVLDIAGSGITYEVGDSIGVFPQHDPELVDKTLKALQATGSEIVHLKSTGEMLALRDCLTSKSNLTDISPKLLKEIVHRQTNAEKKHLLEVLLEEDNRGALKAYLGQHEIWDLLEAHAEVHFQPQELIDLLMPLLPRFYSIASSQRYVGEEIHLTVAPLEYESNGHKRRGVCTHYLTELAEIENPVVPVFLHPAHSFRLPNDHERDLIMIGPGTGVAPFRAFLQERIMHTKAKGKHWLFFGERHRETDFFYEYDWEAFSQHGHLRMELAFSRDQEHKVYVQHKMLEHGEELFRWLEQGAYLYVCGDAQRMAKDVEAMLLTVIQEFGGKDLKEARDYIKSLRQQKRYLRDVY